MNMLCLRVGAAMSAGVLLTGSLVTAATIHPAGNATTPVHAAKPLTNSTARTTLVAGGATLPALAYMGAFTGSNPKFLPAPTDAKSVFGYFDAQNKLTVSYCQTGSGYGKEVLDGAANAANPPSSLSQEAVNLPCASGSAVVGTNGFQGPQSGTGFPLSDPDFAGSDSPLTQTEYSTFVTNKVTNAKGVQPNRGEPVQVPYIVGAVAILYNNPDLKNQPQINLTSSQICSIFTGKITNWSQLGKPSRPLTYVYRADGSGTTFSFSNWLVKQTGCTDNKSAKLSVSQTFAGSTPVVVETNVATNSASASGNGSVASCVVSNTGCASGAGGPGSIAYVEAANAKATLNVASGIDYATIGTSKADPIKNLPEAAATIANTIDVDKSVVYVQGGLASTPALSPSPATAGCDDFVDPGAYNNLTKGYPIVAVSNLEFGEKANGSTNAANLQKLGKVQFSSTSLVFENKYVIGGTTTSSNAISIDSVDAATTSAGTGKTGYSTLPLVFSPSTNSTISKAIGCIGA